MKSDRTAQEPGGEAPESPAKKVLPVPVPPTPPPPHGFFYNIPTCDHWSLLERTQREGQAILSLAVGKFC